MVERFDRKGDPKEFERLFGTLGGKGATGLSEASKDLRKRFKAREFAELGGHRW